MRFLSLLCFAGLLFSTASAQLDNEKTKQIWRVKYGVTAGQADNTNPVGWLDQDDDGDGLTNGEEMAAGTNPFNASTTIRVTSVVLNGGNAELTFPTETGKRYRVECSTSLATPSYILQPQPTPTEVTGDGNSMMISVPHPGDCFYRVRVDEIDTDGDSVSDWAELEAGLDPNQAESTPGVNDGDFVAEQIMLPNEVNILAEAAFAFEDGPRKGSFKVTRKQKLLPLTVDLLTDPGSTAVAGVDYTALPGSINFASGEDTVMVEVTPMPNAPSTEGSESVTAALVAPDGAQPTFTLGANVEATVIIEDSTVATGTGLLAQYWDYAGFTYMGDGKFGAPATYDYTKTGYGTPNTGNIVVTPSESPALNVGDVISMAFTSGNLNSPSYNNQNYTVTAVYVGFFRVAITGASLPSSSSGNCVMAISATPPAPAITRVDATVDNDWGAGIPPGISTGDNFSIRWTGQVQPEFSEEYTFIVHADDGCRLTLNGQVQPLKTLPATISGTGTTYSYNNATGNTVVTYTGSLVQPNGYEVGEIVRLDPSSGNLTHSGGSSTYTYDSVSGDAVITYSNVTSIIPGSMAAGQTVEVDPTSGPASSLVTTPYQITAASPSTFTVNFGAGVFSSGSGNITISDNRDLVITAATATTFTVNHGAGKYYSGTGNMNIDIVNKPLKDFASMGSERYVRIPMVGGVRYDIDLEYYENTGTARCRLFWQSPSRPKQIIPMERLYPANGPLAPASHVTGTDAVALVGGSFSQVVAGSNGATVALSGNPAWLTYSNGVLSGTPPGGAAGDYQVLITITNALGTSTSVLNLHVEDTGGTVEREYWNGVAGTSVASIPTETTPDGTENLSSLEAASDFGDNYGARIRGYITAPTTGNYYFWIAANNAAELWISNDDETVNAFMRATVNTGSATPQNWNGETNQKSPWLALEQGQRYYFEILHKAGVGGDSLAVGWAKPDEDGTAPSEVVPGCVLSPYVPPAPGSTPGTLYVATMLSQGAAVSSGVGVATMRLSEDENVAYVSFDIPGFLSPPYNGLSGIMTDWHVHNDVYQGHPSSIMYDPDPTSLPPDSGPQPDGSHKWTIPATVGTLSKAAVVELIKEGKAYINVHTALYPAGEIRGNFTLANGTRSFTPPPAPPAWTDDHTNDAAAVRFLQQATFGANIADIQALKAMSGYEAWIDDQFTKPASHQLPEVLESELSDVNGAVFDETLTFNAWWHNSISGEDQLRQRIAFALSQIHVVSAANAGPLEDNARATSYFYDKLADNAFANFRDILVDTTLTPSMGRYLDMLRNDKPEQALGRIPNENYAREIKQLFSIGLYRMWPDGTLMLTSKDAPIDTYTQLEIVGLSHVFTGWDYGYDGGYRTAMNAPTNWTRQMREVPLRHYTGTKRLLNNVVLPGIQTLGGPPLDPLATHNSSQYNHPAYQALPGQELDAAHDLLFNHPNTGPFICRQLIQRMVTSHPSRDYLYRVVQKFNDNGSGVRGDMQAVIKAILLDYEARHPGQVSVPAFGKQREPLLRIAAVGRALRPGTFTGTYVQNGSHVITITAPNNLAGGNNVFLEFPRPGEFVPGDITPSTQSYVVLSTPAPTATTFSVNAKGWAGVSTSNGSSNAGISGTYSAAANATTATVTLSGHWLPAGGSAYLDFELPTGTAIADGVYQAVTSNSTTGGGTTFTINVPLDAAARSGRVRMAGFRGSYTVTNSGLPVPQERRITFDTTYWSSSAEIIDHHLNVGDHVFLNFTAGNPRPPDAELIVESVPDSNTFTVLTDAAGTSNGTDRDNGMWMFPLVSQPMVRNGTVGSRSSTYNMGNTNADLDQTPIDAPTVFNYFLPDFKNPGALASQGLTTPEFQTTSETTVVRQANFLYNGIFNPGTTNGYSSFKTGNNSLVLDLSPWMPVDATNVGLGAPTSTTLPWTHNENIVKLIDHLSILLTANQIPSSVKTVIKNFVSLKVTSISTGNPCTVTTESDHGYVTGESVVVSGVTNGTISPTLNDTSTLRVITVTGPKTFTLTGVNCTVAPNASGLTNAHASQVAYSQGTTNPSTTNKRDRLRAILHLILSSPDYTIQR